MTDSANSHKFQWQQTMLRIKDPKISIPFYEEHFGLKLIHSYDFPEWKFALYFMASVPPEEEASLPEQGTKEGEDYLWSMKGVTLELTHNYGTESDPDFKVNNGNVEPFRGFGHIAFMTRDVYKASEEIEAAGVKMQKRPDEGNMKGLSFALDPDGYWLEIIKRADDSKITNKYTLAQTMIRIKDPKKSLHFYRDLLGMTLLNEMHMGVGESWGFSLFFLAHIPEGQEELAKQPGYITTDLFGPVLELTHNHGTENRPDFSYYNGNDQDKEGQIRGFGHIGYLCDNLDEACEGLERRGVVFKKKPADGSMRSLAFAYDPDNYWVELIARGKSRFPTGLKKG